MTDLNKKLLDLAKEIAPLQAEGKISAGSWEAIAEVVNLVGRLETQAVSRSADDSFKELKEVLDNFDPVADRVKEIVGDMLNQPTREITLQSNLIDDLFADDLDTIEITMEIEDEFEITITDEEADKNFITVGQIVDYLKTFHADAIKKWARP